MGRIRKRKIAKWLKEATAPDKYEDDLVKALFNARAVAYDMGLDTKPIITLIKRYIKKGEL